MSIPDATGSVGFWCTVVDQGQAVYTVFMEGRPVTPADRGRATWPRVTGLFGQQLVVLRARIWPGDAARMSERSPIVWLFAPVVTATLDGRPVALGLTVHVLELAGFKWGRGGRRRLEMAVTPRGPGLAALKRKQLLDRSVAVARAQLANNASPTRVSIADALVNQEPDRVGSVETIYTRWRRSRPPITLTEILEAAAHE